MSHFYLDISCFKHRSVFPFYILPEKHEAALYGLKVVLKMNSSRRDASFFYKACEASSTSGRPAGNDLDFSTQYRLESLDDREEQDMRLFRL